MTGLRRPAAREARRRRARSPRARRIARYALASPRFTSRWPQPPLPCPPRRDRALRGSSLRSSISRRCRCPRRRAARHLPSPPDSWTRPPAKLRTRSPIYPANSARDLALALQFEDRHHATFPGSDRARHVREHAGFRPRSSDRLDACRRSKTGRDASRSGARLLRSARAEIQRHRSRRRQSARVDKGDLHIAPDNAKRLAISVGPLAPGLYKVVWHVTSTDTHKTEGSFSFTVGK